MKLYSFLWETAIWLIRAFNFKCALQVKSKKCYNLITKLLNNINL